MKLSLRATMLLSMIRDPQSELNTSPYSRDDPWVELNRLPHFGPKTLDELVKAGLLKERPLGHWSGYGRRWFRLAPPEPEPFPEDEDFGDLWVAA